MPIHDRGDYAGSGADRRNLPVIPYPTPQGVPQ